MVAALHEVTRQQKSATLNAFQLNEKRGIMYVGIKNYDD